MIQEIRRNDSRLRPDIATVSQHYGPDQMLIAVGIAPMTMTIKRMVNHPGSVSQDIQAKRVVLEAAGVSFIKGSRQGVRMSGWVQPALPPISD